MPNSFKRQNCENSFNNGYTRLTTINLNYTYFTKYVISREIDYSQCFLSIFFVLGRRNYFNQNHKNYIK